MTGQELLNRWIAFFRRYLAITETQGLVLALWAVNTWVYERFGSTPYLEVYAATRGCGKTRVLEVLALLVRGPEQMATARIAPIVRLIAEHQGKITLLIDEAEKLAAGSINETRSALASGYRKGSSHPVTTASGVVRYPTYCPKAFALIGNIQPILRDRSIPIFLQQGKPPADLLAEYAQATETADELKTELFRLSQSGAFAHPPLSVPEWLYGRDAEIWTALFSVAACLNVHKTTYEALQAASVDLSALKELPALPSHAAKASDEGAEELAAAERLLTDVKLVTREDDTVIATEELLARLRDVKTSPWRVWRGKGLDAIVLAALLSRYGLAPEKIQVGKGRKDRKIVRGYRTSKIRAARA